MMVRVSWNVPSDEDVKGELARAVYTYNEPPKKISEFSQPIRGVATLFCIYKGFVRKIQRKKWHQTNFAPISTTSTGNRAGVRDIVNTGYLYCTHLAWNSNMSVYSSLCTLIHTQTYSCLLWTTPGWSESTLILSNESPRRITRLNRIDQSQVLELAQAG